MPGDRSTRKLLESLRMLSEEVLHTMLQCYYNTCLPLFFRSVLAACVLIEWLEMMTAVALIASSGNLNSKIHRNNNNNNNSSSSHNGSIHSRGRRTNESLQRHLSLNTTSPASERRLEGRINSTDLWLRMRSRSSRLSLTKL